ncbi:MAG: branched-chain amino acid ABC transporter substrate-binding protein [Thermodesulfobacteriota bacterium]|nr:MAG: branched-chain amino acid ABC transporter substrate-binding protein [Thermodesulfobacteriota bacterium]
MNKIKIGLSISLTGNYSIQGIESFEGIKLWVSDVNRQGGIYLRNQGSAFLLELIYYNDESSVEKCRTNTEKLILEDEVDLLLGPYSSSLALASCEIAEEHNKTLWNHGGSTDEIEERGFDCVINAITPASNYSHGIIDALIEADPNIKKIATFSAKNSGFSTRVSNGAKEYAESLGLNVREYKFISGTEVFSNQLDDLDSCEPDLILGMGRAEDDLALAEQLFSKGLNSKAAGFIVASIKLFKDKFGKKADNILSASQWERGLKIKPDIGPTPEEFTEHFKSVYDKEPDYVAAQGYNIGIIIEKCIEEIGTFDDLSLREIAKDTEFKTFYGTFKTDFKGNQIGHEMVVVQWQDGEKVIVYPKSLAQALILYPR